MLFRKKTQYNAKMQVFVSVFLLVSVGRLNFMSVHVESFWQLCGEKKQDVYLFMI